MATFVLVHGAYHGAWCWYKVTPELEARGHSVATFDLPAHGVDVTPVSQVSMEDYVNTVCETISRLATPVVLVGHSMAGMVVTQVTERVPDSIETVVYLTAYLPADGEAMIDKRVEGSLISRNFSVDTERGVGVVSEDAINELFYEDCSVTDKALARSLVRPEPIEPLSTPVSITQTGFGQVRRAYVMCTEDRAITPEQQQTMIDAMGCDMTERLPASHSPFFSMPEETADAFEAVAPE